MRADLRVVRGGEQGAPAAVRLLALPQRVVGAVEKLLVRGGDIRIGGDAQGGRHADRRIRQQEGRAQHAADFLAQRRQPGRVAEAAQHDGELVAADARHRVAVGDGMGREALRGLHQQQVAGGMAVHVVDRLEAVQIGNADRDAPAGLAGDVEFAPELFEEGMPVRQVGQRVFVGQACIALVELGGPLKREHERLEAPEIRHHDGEQPGGHQQEIDRHRDEGGLARGGEEEEERAVDHGGHDDGSRRQVHQREHAGDDGDRHVEGDMRPGERIAVGKERHRPAGEGDCDHHAEDLDAPQRGPRLPRLRRNAASEPPLDHADDACQRQDNGGDDRERRRRDADMGGRQRPGVDQQDQVHQRQELRERLILGLGQFRIVRCRGRAQMHQTR